MAGLLQFCPQNANRVHELLILRMPHDILFKSSRSSSFYFIEFLNVID